MIYFVKEQGQHGRIKIGYSNDIEQRLKSLQAANGSQLRLMAVIHGGPRMESNLHVVFSHLRLHGEWFRAGEELLGYIMETKTSGLDISECIKKAGHISARLFSENKLKVVA